VHSPSDGIGPLGALVPGPPWVLGARGAPREAPENTLAALRRAIELGLDGVAYELRASATGELFLLADDALDRTTESHGPLELRTLPELSQLDAGGWFDGRFAGEPLAMLEEALQLAGNQAGRHPLHLIELRGPGLVAPVASALRGARHLSARVATARRDTCIELRDAGLAPLLIASEPSDELARFLKRERIEACGLTGRGWPPESSTWPSERWALNVDDPAQLLRACQLPVHSLTTREPARALAARALAHLAPGVERWPIEVGELSMDAGARLAGGGEWAGSWDLAARLTNPFGWKVEATLALRVRRGAFEARGLPAGGPLEPGEQLEVGLHLAGGSWSPGGDPVLDLHLAWERGPGRPGEGLTFDAPLARVRRLAVGAETLRLPLLRERPSDPPASVTLRLRRGQLMVAIESPGGLADARLLVHLDGREHRGGATVRASLPPDFARRAGGVPFSAAIAGTDLDGKRPLRRLRRWAGGVPAEEDAGVPGRLEARARA
jgi:glycerophosphoryl diester phosphodiesterase